MKTKLIKIGNSQGITLTKQLLRQYDFETEIEIVPKKEGILLKASKPAPRSGWEAQFEKAQQAGHQPDSEMLEGFSNQFEQTEWKW